MKVLSLDLETNGIMKILITVLVFVVGKCKVSLNEIYELSNGMEDFSEIEYIYYYGPVWFGLQVRPHNTA